MHKSYTMFKLRDFIYETIMEFRLGDIGYGDFIERIIALFPTLKWEDKDLYLNNVWVGGVRGHEDMSFYAFNTIDELGWFFTLEDAKNGLEANVRELLGWDS